MLCSAAVVNSTEQPVSMYGLPLNTSVAALEVWEKTSGNFAGLPLPDLGLGEAKGELLILIVTPVSTFDVLLLNPKYEYSKY